ncbi:NADH-quinone oxidoreductase subunit M [Compostibacter hankyongensis]|uniref:NADH-quinone oxidoreductase subunit M n=1 Tax=Compostibacter hankyongensis TaxID=1007089 RepID=A0ABP8FGN0_9BACT
MLTFLLILIPLLGGLITFGLKGNGARIWSLATALVTLALAATAGVAFRQDPSGLGLDVSWIRQLGSRFSIGLDGMGMMLVLLTAVTYVVIFLAALRHDYERPHHFYGLMLLTQAGLMGVFTAYDALLFYVCWELVLIPVYFLCSIWGGPRRIAVTFKFFVYTFFGSLLMLVGIIYLYFQTPGTHSFSWEAFTHLQLGAGEQQWLFWLFFVAFAIKMPVFPFHTWQPDTYEQAPTPVTMVLSAIMVKMGLFGIIRWVLPVLPQGVAHWSHLVILLSVIGIVYASCIAIVQTDLKRLFAYSSIAHMGLMCAAVFSGSEVGMQGVLVQMFNHGIIITGLWVVVEMLEQRLGTKAIGDMGGIALKAPRIAIAFMIICLGNVALPLTSGFVGEFMMFSGLYHYNGWMMAVAGLAIILGAVYILRMLQRVIFGDANSLTEKIKDIKTHEWLAVAVVIGLILFLGIYPKPLLELVGHTTQTLWALRG